MSEQKPFTVVTLNYITLYMADLEKAVAFYTAVFGPPASHAATDPRYGWRMGDTWLTLFSNEEGTDKTRNPANTEFAIQVATPEQVDNLYQHLIDAGATAGWPPEDTEMYEGMRFCYVDDPFGVRIDIICPIKDQ